MENIIKIKNFKKDYGDFKLKDISFELKTGTIMGFVGENGSGKTTTIKAILGIIKRDAGDIELFGENIDKIDKDLKNDIGVVLDDGFFIDILSVEDIHKSVKKIYKNWNENKFNKFMVDFKLPIDKPISSFSKGMKVKLSIALALSHNARLLILDEPTAGLDPIVRNEILDILLEFIQDENNAVLISTHITSDLDKIADSITFINNGKVEFSKTTDELTSYYGLLKSGINDFDKIDKGDVIGYRKNKFGYDVLIKNREFIDKKYKDFTIDEVNIEEIMLYHIRGDK